MPVYKVLFANNTVVSCEETKDIALNKDVCYRHQDSKLISAYLHADSAPDAITRAYDLVNETLAKRNRCNEIIVIEEQVNIYSEELRQLYLQKASELRKIVSYFQSVEEGAMITFWGTEHLGMLSTKIEIDGCEDKLADTLRQVCRQFSGSFLLAHS